MIGTTIRIIDKITEIIGRAATLLALFLVLTVVVDVALRYFFSISFAALRELEWHAYAALFLLGGAYTLRYDAHVRVDVLYQHLSDKHKALINVLGCLLFLFPGCYLIIKTSLPMVQFSYMMSEISPDPGGLHYRWLIKALIPFGFGLIALQGVSFFLKNLLVLMGKREHRLEA